MNDRERLVFLEAEVRELREDMEQFRRLLHGLRDEVGRPMKDVRALIDGIAMTLPALEVLEKD